jgi:glycosyltransferase involved in cell wall biosynthesis
MNICIISREFPPDTAFGGISSFSVDTACMLRKHGHKVTVFSQSLGPSNISILNGVKVHKINVPKWFANYNNLPLFILAFNFLIYREVMRCHKVRPFDLIDVPDHLAEGLFCSIFSKIPIVTRLHTPFALIVDMKLNNYKKDFSYYLIWLMEFVALRKSKVLYAPCIDIVKRCNLLFDIKNKPLQVFGYPLDIKLFSPMMRKYEGSPRILFLGRLEQRKGIETIAAAFPKVYLAYPGATLTIVGHDTPNVHGFNSARLLLECAFKKNKCAAAVRYIDHVPLKNLPDIFNKHDIVWIPSMYDNYPLICLEAMACGKSVVVSDAGGLTEMVKHNETGLVFPAGDANSLSVETLKLCTSSKLRKRLSSNARSYVEKNCSYNLIHKKTLKLYRIALERKC